MLFRRQSSSGVGHVDDQFHVASRMSHQKGARILLWLPLLVLVACSESGGIPKDGPDAATATSTDNLPRHDQEHDANTATDNAPDHAKKTDVPFLPPDAGDTCRVDIVPVSPLNLVGLIAGPTAVLRVQGNVVWGKTTPFPYEWTWQIIRSDGEKLTPKAVNEDSSLIQFPISIAARYDISASIGQGCAGFTRALAQDPQIQSRIYRLRALPPFDDPNLNAVPYEADLKIMKGSASIPKIINFDQGTVVSIDPCTGPGSRLTRAVPSLVQIQSTGSSWIINGRSSNQSPFRTVLDSLLEYQVLVVPDKSDEAGLPPFLLNQSVSNHLKVDASYIKANADPMPLPEGAAISGFLTSSDGPVSGATISLYSLQPSSATGQTVLNFSTIGQTDESGAYTLRVNPPGTFSVVIKPPEGSSLPLATVSNFIYLDDKTTAVPDLNFSWSFHPTTNLELAVTLPNGDKPKDRVDVYLELDETDIPVGRATAGSSAGVDTSGEGHSDQGLGQIRRKGATSPFFGTVTFANLPKYRYKVTLVPSPPPGNGKTSDAITTTTIDLSNAGNPIEGGNLPDAGPDASPPRPNVFQASIPLATKVTVYGYLLDADGVSTQDSAGTTVVATDLGNETMPTDVMTKVDSSGMYVLLLDPNRTYRLVALPAAEKGLPSYVPLLGFTTNDANMQLDSQRIPKGVHVHGQVTFAGSAVAGAIIQAFCVGQPPDCLDRTNLAAGSPPAFAKTVADSSGNYSIILPDPSMGE
jgi:hypothetical protein